MRFQTSGLPDANGRGATPDRFPTQQDYAILPMMRVPTFPIETKRRRKRERIGHLAFCALDSVQSVQCVEFIGKMPELAVVGDQGENW